ncbi:PREDICTED: LOC110613993 [Prunus dulcis]|uniref:PREDICTED: LOC110613993 n=1 Tax=Prunus dulcis TaxID=3755 RepID=A0A5E4ESI5_PRUDU|nr:uncharacterized protein LOC117623250 [Prunus dulcis]KAI5336994.1 hypothetical protein L3X38_016263 [Prunus dulcis]VVA18654.1 PREDICTED: LOC110613993 [Prunus dulcis]
MAKVCCSIELEPRTLSEGQLNHARELAADVVEKMEPEEASAIFIQGLRPVGSMKDMVHMVAEEGEQLQSKVVEWKEAQILETPPCQCLCSTVNIESPDQGTLTEPLSAPF